MRARLATLLAAAGLSLGGCAYGDLGLGVGYGNYGYGGPYYGYGYGGPYYGGYYGSGYGYGSPYYGGYGSPYFGWYNDYYYPGTGYYVYDRYRHRREMTDAERQYWRQRVASSVANRVRENGGVSTTETSSVRTREIRPNWSGFNRRQTAAESRQTVRAERQTTRAERQTTRAERQAAREQRRSNQSSDD